MRHALMSTALRPASNPFSIETELSTWSLGERKVKSESAALNGLDFKVQLHVPWVF